MSTRKDGTRQPLCVGQGKWIIRAWDAKRCAWIECYGVYCTRAGAREAIAWSRAQVSK